MNILIYDDDPETKEAYEYACEVGIKKHHEIVFINTFMEFHEQAMRHWDIALIDYNLDFFGDTYLTALDILPIVYADKKAIVSGFPDLNHKIEGNYPIFLKPIRGYHLKQIIDMKPRDHKDIPQSSRWKMLKNYFISEKSED